MTPTTPLPCPIPLRLGRPLDDEEAIRADAVERLLAAFFSLNEITSQVEPRWDELPPELIRSVAVSIIEDPLDALPLMEE